MARWHLRFNRFRIQLLICPPNLTFSKLSHLSEWHHHLPCCVSPILEVILNCYFALTLHKPCVYSYKSITPNLPIFPSSFPQPLPWLYLHTVGAHDIPCLCLVPLLWVYLCLPKAMLKS